jgi:hypothetical protein
VLKWDALRIDVQEIEVVQNGRTYDVVSATVIEGGFFSKSAAEAVAAYWRQELVNDQVEKAERAAGWDPRS